MNNRDIILPLLRIVIPGDHDPALDYFPAKGPKGGKLSICPHGAFNPKNFYLTKIIRNKNVGVRHGYRGFWKYERFSLFSITLPDDPIVRAICEMPWKYGKICKADFNAARIHGDFQPMLAAIKTLCLQAAIKKANGNTE